MPECICHEESEESSGDEVEDKDARDISYIGLAAYDELRKHHNHHWHECWNVTSGVIIGEVHQTPLNAWGDPRDPPNQHSDWLPRKMFEIMSRTQSWCDVSSLGPPDGTFLEHMKDAIATINDTAVEKGGDPIIIRILFGNIIGMPVDCHRVIQDLVSDIDEEECNIKLWVGSWRRGVSWNHSKIIAVDGKHLHTGGHNMWDPHYLKNNPVHDLSMEAYGRCAHDGHLFLNKQWEFVEMMQSGLVGWVVDKLPDWLPTPLQNRVTVSEFPEGVAAIFPPMYDKSKGFFHPVNRGRVPMITMGRYGAILYRARPSDDAILAMINASKVCIRLALQDLGPVCFPGTKIALPSCVWPKAILEGLGRAIYERGVVVEIALSNPGSIPGSLRPTEALYGNGWECADVASEIIKVIRDMDEEEEEEEDDDMLRRAFQENLRLCYIRRGHMNKWGDGQTMGMHSKHFIIDDAAYYIGSQNLYTCDLAEWGVLVDDVAQTRKVMNEYWIPMWANSYQEDRDCNVDEVMDGLDIDRNGESNVFASTAEKEEVYMQAAGNFGHSNYRTSA